MEINRQIENLASQLQSFRKPLRITLDPLPSGLTYLHVVVGNRCFVLAYYPKENGFGVDEVLEHEGFEMGYKYWFKEFEPAKQKLLAMLEAAG